MSERIRIILDVQPSNADRALRIFQRHALQLEAIEPGWGWAFYEDGIRFFARRTKTGYSVQERPA